MSPQAFKLQEIADVVASALVRGGRHYHRRSSGWAPWWAPESMYRECAANATYDRLGLHVVPEMTIDNVMSYGRGEMRGRRPRDSGSGRIDLTVLDAQPMPSVLIELKRGFGSSILADAARLRGLVERRGSARFGLIAVHAVAKRSCDDGGFVSEFAEENGLSLLALREYRSGWDTTGDYDPDRLLIAAVFRA